METRRRLKKIGGSVALFIPPYAAGYLLETLGYELRAEEQNLEDFAVSIAIGELETTDIARWFESHTRRT